MSAHVSNPPGRRPFLADPQRREQLRRSICEDIPIKAVAQNCAVSQKVAYAAANTLGFSRMYVTQAERVNILRRRERGAS